MLSAASCYEPLVKKSVYNFKSGFKFDPPKETTGFSFKIKTKKPVLTVEDLKISMQESESVYEMFEMLGWLYIQQNHINYIAKLLLAMQSIHGSPIITYGLKSAIKYYVDMGMLYPAHIWLEFTRNKPIKIK